MVLSPETQLTQLAEFLAGEFDNQAQSLAEPIWYLHLRVWNRPLPSPLFDTGYAFFIEQISVASGNPPYRQRLLHLTYQGETLWGQYYGLRDPGHWQGSASQPERLTQITLQDLISLPTCTLQIDYTPTTGQYSARPPADSLCCITYQGQQSYIRLGFDLGPAASPPDRGVELKVYDRGIDPATGKTTWGPLMGPFRLMRQQAYSI